jgi:hypothetical protein
MQGDWAAHIRRVNEDERIRRMEAEYSTAQWLVFWLVIIGLILTRALG